MAVFLFELCLLNSLMFSGFLAGEGPRMSVHGPSPLLCSPKKQRTDSSLSASPLHKMSIHLPPFIFSPSQHAWLNAFSAFLQYASREPNSLSQVLLVIDGRR